MNAASFVLILTGLSLAAPLAAAEPPKRKSGLWELTTGGDATGGHKMTIQLCVEEKQDDVARHQTQRMGKETERQCSKVDAKTSGNKTTIHSVCKVGDHTATSDTVITGNLAREYRMESTTEYTPPMFGKAKMQTVMTGKWLGPCKAGQRHGSMSVVGLPGGMEMPGDPEMLRQMQKMHR